MGEAPGTVPPPDHDEVRERSPHLPTATASRAVRIALAVAASRGTDIASAAALVSMTGSSERTVRRALADLEGRGLVVRMHRHLGAERRYRLALVRS
jgi:DNA-binding transcriptional ArsR family regulator